MALAATPAARADQPAPGDPGPYRIHWPVDLPVMGGAGAIILTTQFLIERAVTPSCPCPSDAVPGIDRWVVERRSAAAKLASDLGVGVMMLLPYGLDAFDVLRARGLWSGFVADAVVITEAMLLNGALNQLVKLAVQRPRPLAHDRPAGDPALRDHDNFLSFYSSHTSTSFAAGISYATTFALRHRSPLARVLVYGGAAAGGATVGLMRMLAGRHFTTDVLTGALVGTAVGVTVPLLHRGGSPVLPVAMPLPGAGGAGGGGGGAVALVGRF